MKWFGWNLVAACLFVFALLAPAVGRSAILQWPVASGGNDHYYMHIAQTVTWQEAADLAAAFTFNGMPGYLTTITSAGENNFIINNFNQRGWLGGSDAAVEGEWRWVVGPEAGQMFFKGKYPDPTRVTLIYADWGGNEPNDYDNTRFGFPYPGEDYVQFDPARGGEWNDSPGAPQTDSGFYVEFSAVVPEGSTLALSLSALVALIAFRSLGGKRATFTVRRMLQPQNVSNI
jgi:hypothetical protein